LTVPWDDAFEGLLRPLLPLLPATAPMIADLDLVRAGLDSLNVVELLAVVEDHYGIVLADHEISQDTVSTPARLWAVVNGHLRTPEAGTYSASA
jgi:acyl carrier protein